MSDTDEFDQIESVLSQVVPLSPSLREAELGAAVSRHVSNRSAGIRGGPPDQETVAALRVTVDFNELLERLGEPQAWDVLGKLRDLFGSTP
jgi:hypothetical protein